MKDRRGGESSIVESMLEVEIDIEAEIEVEVEVEIDDPETPILSYSTFLEGNAMTRDGNT